jgi:hypothetical protein
MILVWFLVQNAQPEQPARRGQNPSRHTQIRRKSATKGDFRTVFAVFKGRPRQKGVIGSVGFDAYMKFA